MFFDFGLVEAAVATQMIPVFEERARMRAEAAERERAMLAAMTPEERSAYWEERKVRALEAQARATRDAADAARDAAHEAEMSRLRGRGPGFGMGVVLGAVVGKGMD